MQTTEPNKHAEAQSFLTDKLERLASLAKLGHTYCEDPWYSCPQAEDGCADERRGPECDCGADEHNKEIEMLVGEIKQFLRSNANVTGLAPNGDRS